MYMFEHMMDLSSFFLLRTLHYFFFIFVKISSSDIPSTLKNIKSQILTFCHWYIIKLTLQNQPLPVDCYCSLVTNACLILF